MVDQMRRSSRSVCGNIGEAWRKRRYKAHFVSKLSDAEGEAEETRVWLDFALRCQYLNKDQFEELDHLYDNIIGRLVRMLTATGTMVDTVTSPRLRVSVSPRRLSC